jgi:hypothetical protein
MSNIMAGTYKISAIPLLYTRGTFEGKLQGASFTAVSPSDTKEWFTNNCGQFELEFSKLMPMPVARAMVAALMHGDEVELPGFYEEERFERGFIFEWPMAHFMTASQFAHQRIV